MYIHGCKQTPPTPPTTSDEESSGSSDDAEMKKKKGNRAMGKKKYPKAIKYYSKAIKIDQQNATYHLNRAIANAALELWKDAEGDASNAVRLGNPPSMKGHFQLARARLRRGRCEEAREALQVGLAANPEEAALLQLRREVDGALRKKEQEARRRKLEEERAARQAGPVAGPGNARALTDQARSLSDGGRSEEAVELLLQARELLRREEGTRPPQELGREQISAVSLLGKARMRLRQWQDAADAFKEVVDLEERLFSMENRDEREALSNAYNNLGIACKNAGRMAEAVAALRAAYAKATNGDEQVANPQVAQILQNLAQCLRAQGEILPAKDMYVRALEVGQRLFGNDNASNALNHVCIARCLVTLGQIKEAIESYTKAIEIWMRKDMDTCLAEMPEVPNKERLAVIQQQCKTELGQLVLMVEQRSQEARQGEASAPAASAPAAAAEESAASQVAAA